LLGLLVEAFSLHETVTQNLMLSHIGKDSNLMLTRLVPVITLTDTKQ